MGILENLRNYSIAMEADDIRKEAADGAKSLSGGSDDDVTTGHDGTDDISKTDDIFGIAANKEKQSGTDNNADEDNNEDNQTDDTNNEDNNPDDQDESDDMTDSDTNGDDNSDEDTNNEDSTPDYYDKNKLKENMIYFYNIIVANTISITELTGRLNEQEDIDLCNRVGSNLRSCSKILYDDLTQNMKDYSYEELKRDYVTIKRVFDLCNEMLYKHFGKDSKEIIRLKKRK